MRPRHQAANLYWPDFRRSFHILPPLSGRRNDLRRCKCVRDILPSLSATFAVDPPVRPLRMRGNRDANCARPSKVSADPALRVSGLLNTGESSAQTPAAFGACRISRQQRHCCGSRRDWLRKSPLLAYSHVREQG